MARVAVAALVACVLGIHCRAEPAPVSRGPAPDAAAAPPEIPRCSPPEVRVIEPAERPADTTLVVLHGYGASAADIEPVAWALAAARPRLAVLVPDGCDPFERSSSGRQWWALDGSERDRAARLATGALRVTKLVDAELSRRGLPRDRVAWAGFSQGAMLSQWMAVHATPRPLAVVSFSGRFDDDAPPGPPVGTPVLLIHGERDQRIPFAESARSEQALLARGAKVERVDRPTMAHAIDRESLAAAVAFLGRTLGDR
jgi:phospholipase/carboxylesterase